MERQLNTGFGQRTALALQRVSLHQRSAALQLYQSEQACTYPGILQLASLLPMYELPPA